jgi:hypothetical protein
MGSKRLGLLRDLLPSATRVAVLVDPNDDAMVVKSMIADVRGAAARRGASVFKMRDVSRHKSMDVLQAYVRDADRFRDHAGAGLL